VGYGGSSYGGAPYGGSGGASAGPGTPVASHSGLGNNVATLSGSAYSSDGHGTHAATQWQLTLATDPTYSSPVVDTGDDASDLTSYSATGLGPGTAYIWRLRYKASDGTYSDWGTDSFATTNVTARVTQVVREVLARPPAADARVTQVVREVLVSVAQAPAPSRVSAVLGVLTVAGATPPARVDQLAGSVTVQRPTPPARVTQALGLGTVQRPTPPTRATQLLAYLMVRTGCQDTLYSATEKLIVGDTANNAYEFGRGLADGAGNAPPTYVLRTNAVALDGEGGEVALHNVYVVLQWTAAVSVKATPIVDGQRFGPTYIGLSASDAYTRNRFEVAVSQPYTAGGIERFRVGARGTWLEIELEVAGWPECNACGDLIFEGIEFEWDAVQEGLQVPGHVAWTTYTAKDVQPGAFAQSSKRLILGATADGRLLDLGSGYDDDGSAIAAVGETNWVAPAGVGGEASFHNLYVVLTRTNTTTCGLVVTPVVDGAEKDPVTLTLAALAADTEVSEVHEVPLSARYVDASGIEQGRNALRGVWFTARIATTGDSPLVDGDVLIDGVALEQEPVMETAPGLVPSV
jgi:hypothetical protein